MKKSFATAFFAALSVFALAFLASVLLVQGTGFQNAQLESRMAFERFEDARDLVNWTQEDAIVDAAYAFVCNSQEFCNSYSSLSGSYWAGVRGELNDSVAQASFSGMPSCSWNQINPATFSFGVGFGGVLSAYSQHSFKNSSFAFAKTGTVQIVLVPTRGGSVSITETGTAFSFNCAGGPGGGLGGGAGEGAG